MNYSAVFITAVYLILGILWITVSGELLHTLAGGSDIEPRYEIYKGLLYVIVTGLIIFFLIKKRENILLNLQDELSLSYDKWKNIFENANDPILILDKSKRIKEVNTKATEVFGFNKSEFSDLNLSELISEPVIDNYSIYFNKTIEKGSSEFDIIHKKKNGDIFPAEISLRAVVKNNELEFIYILHDLSLRRNIQEKLIQSENKYRTLVETSHELVWSVDAEGKIKFVNNASKDIYGYGPEQMIGKKFTDFATEDQVIYDIVEFKKAVEKGDKFLQYESKITDAFGKEKHLLTNCVINRNEDGSASGMLGTSLDITERFESGERVKLHNKVYALLSNMNQLIVRAKDETQILNDACRLAVDYGMFRLAWVGIIDETTGRIIPKYFYGSQSEYLKSLNISINESDEYKGPIVRAFLDKTYYVSNDIESDSLLIKWRNETLRIGLNSFAVFPIEVKNNVKAVYCIYSEKKHFFGKTETELLLELSEDISFALEYIELEKERKIIEDHYKNIVEKAPVGIYTQTNNIITYINPAGYRLLGASTHKEIIGKNIFDIINKEMHGKIESRLTELRAGKPVGEIEEKFRKLDGTEIDVMVSGIPQKVNGNFGVQVFFRDITQQKAAQKQIFEANERFNLITRATNDVLWDWNIEKNEIWWNEGFKDIFGYNDEDIETGIESWTNRIHPDEKNNIVNNIHKAIENGHEFWFDEYHFRKKDGSYAYVFDRAYLVKNSKNKVYRIVGSMLDISFRKKMENELKNSEQKWRSLFEYSPSMIFTINREYNITSLNHSAIPGVDPLDFIGRNGLEFVAPEDHIRVKDIVEKIFSEKHAESFELKSNFPSEDITYSMQAVPVIVNDTVDTITFIASDITEKIKADHKIREANETLHALAAHLQTIREEERTMISREIHDQLGQELTALKMDIAFLSRKIDKIKYTNKPDWNELLEGLKSMSDITDQTINSVRRIARELRPDVLDKLGLKEAIEWQAEEFTKRTGIDCIVSIDENEFNFSRDLENTVFRIIQESLTNVARHSGANRAKIGLIIRSKNIYLTIEDNGRGITEKEINNSKSLGLVGIKERAYSVHGKLSISGEINKGTTLKIIIPAEI